MDWNDVGNIVKKSAPVLGTVIGAPAGGAIGGAISMLLGAFGLGGDSTPDQVAQAVAADPQAALKLRELENAHQEELAKLALASDQAYLSDKAAARAREVEVVKATGKADKNLYVLAWTVVVGFFGLVGYMTTSTISAANIGPINQLYGAMGVGFATVLSYFFGSSKGSSEKTQLLSMAPPITGNK